MFGPAYGAAVARQHVGVEFGVLEATTRAFGGGCSTEFGQSFLKV